MIVLRYYGKTFWNFFPFASFLFLNKKALKPLHGIMVLLFLHKSKKCSLQPVSIKKREENSPKSSFHQTIVRSHDSRHSNGQSLQSSKERGIIGESYYQTDLEFRNAGILHNSGFHMCSVQPFYPNMHGSTAINVSVSWFRKKSIFSKKSPPILICMYFDAY